MLGRKVNIRDSSHFPLSAVLSDHHRAVLRISTRQTAATTRGTVAAMMEASFSSVNFLIRKRLFQRPNFLCVYIKWHPNQVKTLTFLHFLLQNTRDGTLSKWCQDSYNRKIDAQWYLSYTFNFWRCLPPSRKKSILCPPTSNHLLCCFQVVT